MYGFKPIPLEKLKTQRPRHYQIVTINLATARTNEELLVVGDFIGVASITGSCTLRVNERNNDAINLQIVRRTKTPFYRFFITNTAQAGKSVTLYIGGDASFEIDVVGRIGIVNVAGTDINPATEDTLATLALESGGNLETIAGVDFATQTTLNLIKAKTDNLDVALSLIKAKTDNLDIALTALRDALLLPATTPVIYNVEMTSEDTEYSQALPSGTKKFSIAMIENDTAFRVAFVTGKVATPTAPYKPVPIAQEYYEESVNLTGKTLYFACSTAGKNVVIIAWT